VELRRESAYDSNGIYIRGQLYVLEEFAFCTRPYSNASVDWARTLNQCSG